MRRFRAVAATAVGAALTFGAFTAADQGHAEEPSACIWAGVGVLDYPTTTVVVDSDGDTCPALPPSAGSPCPGGLEDFRDVPIHGLAEASTYVCVLNL